MKLQSGKVSELPPEGSSNNGESSGENNVQKRDNRNGEGVMTFFTVHRIRYRS